MTVTRCPACLTAFRVSPEQLALRSGRVRCGHCYRPFDALAHALPDEPTPDIEAPEQPERLAPSADRQSAPPEVAAEPDAATLEPLDFIVPEHPAAPSPKPGIPPLARSEPEPEPEPTFSIPPAHTPVAPIIVSHDDAPRWRRLPSTAGNTAPQVFSSRRARLRIEPRAHDETEAYLPGTGTVAALTLDEEQELNDWRRKLYDPTPPPTPYRWLWALGVGITLGVFAAQASYFYRESITREWPQLRSLYLAACERLACEIPLPRVADLLAIERSDLEVVSNSDRHYELHAVLLNRARHPQQIPHLELTLTDRNDRPLARRSLTPKEWLTSDSAPDAGLRAGERIELTLPLHTPELQGVAGYRLAAFYP